MEGPRLYVLTALQIAAVGALFWLLITWAGPWNIERCIGMLLVVVGVSFIGVARYQLGKSFSVRAQAYKLVTRGLYSKIRNPIYTFGIVMLIGIVLVLQNPTWWLVVVAAVIVQTIRARREERVLEVAFGEEYREYRRKTWF